MKRTISVVGLSFLFVIVVLSSCTKAPQDELNAAKAALDTAKAAGADQYLPERYNALTDSLNAAIAEIETQNSKFFLTRNYNRAKALLTETTQRAGTLKDDAVAKKQEVQAEVTKLLADIKNEIAQTRQLIAKAPRGKEGRAALQAMESEINVVETSINEASQLLNSGDYLTARDKLSAGMQKVLDVRNELQTAIAKRSSIIKRTSRK